MAGVGPALQGRSGSRPRSGFSIPTVRGRSKRERLSLAPPPAPARLQEFPHRRMHRGTTLWRMVRKGRNPWWFSSDGQGRFDLPFPEGTCYAALDEIAALLEGIGPDIEGGGVSVCRPRFTPSSLTICLTSGRSPSGAPEPRGFVTTCATTRPFAGRGSDSSARPGHERTGTRAGKF